MQYQAQFKKKIGPGFQGSSALRAPVQSHWVTMPRVGVGVQAKGIKSVKIWKNMPPKCQTRP